MVQFSLKKNKKLPYGEIKGESICFVCMITSEKALLYLRRQELSVSVCI